MTSQTKRTALIYIIFNKRTDRPTDQSINQSTHSNSCGLRPYDWPVLLAFGRYPGEHAWQVVSSSRNSLMAQATQTQQHLCSCPPVWKFWNPKCQRLPKTVRRGDDCYGGLYSVLLPNYNFHTLKIEAAGYSETLLSIHQITRYNIPEDCNIDNDRHETNCIIRC